MCKHGLMRVLIVYGSETGCSEGAVKKLAKKWSASKSANKFKICDTLSGDTAADRFGTDCTRYENWDAEGCRYQHRAGRQAEVRAVLAPHCRSFPSAKSCDDCKCQADSSHFTAECTVVGAAGEGAGVLPIGYMP